MPRLVAAVLCLLAAALLISACGGSSNAPTRTDPADRALAFSRCMRSHGIKDFPDPQVGSGGAVKLQFKTGAGSPDLQKMEKAQHACRHLIAAGREKLTPQERVQREEQVAKFARCMREHGVNIHAGAEGGAVRIQIHPGGAGPNPESPSFQAAQKACQGLLPFKGGPPPGGKGGPGSGPETSKSKGSGAGFALSVGG